MAISKIWSIKNGLSNAINYVKNDEKTYKIAVFFAFIAAKC